MGAGTSRMLHVAVILAALVGAMLSVTPAAAQAVTCPTVDPVTGAVSPPWNGVVDWSGCDLEHAGLASHDLTGDNFSGADLTDATFRLSTLINVDLSGANLTGTNFDSAIMTGANLANATVTSDDFQDAGLANTNLTAVDLSAATLDGVTSGGISSSQAPSAVPTGWRFTVGWLVSATANLANADLANADLSDMDLAGLGLTGIDLTDANLSGTDLSGDSLLKANLTGADLAGATVTNANFMQAVLTDANLAGVDMSTTELAAAQSGGISDADAPSALPPSWQFTSGYLVGLNADLDNADLTGADLSNMNLTYVTMNGADLADVNLTGTQMADASLGAVRSGGIIGQPVSLPPHTAVRGGFIFGPGVNLDGADLAGGNLSGLDLSYATLTNADLAKAGLGETNLSNGDLTGADLRGASFLSTNLTSAVLTGDNLAATSLANSNLSFAVLRNVNLTNGSLGGDNLTGADLTGATLTGLISGHITGLPSFLPANWSVFYGYLFGPGARLGGANLRGDSLVNLDLAGAFLAKANLSGADVRGSDLTNAKLTDANFRGADLAGAEVHAAGVDLKGVMWTGAICPDGRKAGSKGCFSSATAAPHPPYISLSLRVGVPTSAVQVTGTGFKARERVAIYFGPAFMKAGRTSATGVLGPVTITVPPSAQAGLGKITASGKLNGQSASAWFTVATDWAQSRFGPNLDGDNSYENKLGPANVKSLHPAWSFRPGTNMASAPTIADGLAYVGTTDGHLYAVNASTGRKAWNWTVPGMTTPVPLGTPAVSGNIAYVSSNGYIYAIGPGGNLAWKYAAIAPPSAPTVQDGVVYAAAGNVYAISALSGGQLWKVDPASTSGCGTQPAVADGVIYVSCADGNLYALSAATGATLWSYSNGSRLTAPAVTGGVAYVGDTFGDTVHAISTTTHVQLWSYTAGGQIDNTPAVANGTVYISSFDGDIHALNASSGAEEWSFSEGTLASSGISPAVANGVVYVTSPNQIVYALDAQTGKKLWSYSNGSLLQSAPVVADGMLYAGTNSDGIAAFGPR